MLEAFENDLDEVAIVPSSGGVFEVSVDGDNVFSKKLAGRHAEYDEVISAISRRTSR